MEPTPFQKKVFWAALTALSFVVIGSVITLVGGLVIQGISYLQPVLTPIAIAGILAFLLEPVVRWLIHFRISRLWSIVIVYLSFTGLIIGILIWIIPPAYRQGNLLVRNFPEYSDKAQKLAVDSATGFQRLLDNPVLHGSTNPEVPRNQFGDFASKMITDGTVWLQQKVPDIAVESGKFLQRSVGGFLGVFGFMLSMILVPIFLFFFLNESTSISQNWSLYLPLRASPLKVEIVSLLSEINAYLISFFRGQLLVSMIDGAIIAIALLIMGLDFAILIGLMVGVLGLIPYLGMMITWIPAVIIAAAQFNDWMHPLAVTVIFILANNLDGMFIAPKIVGESVGLHPLTVIISVLAWSLILGGLLGALLAVPLTATIKVVLKRYFWDRPPLGKEAAAPSG